MRVADAIEKITQNDASLLRPYKMLLLKLASCTLEKRNFFRGSSYR